MKARDIIFSGLGRLVSVGFSFVTASIVGKYLSYEAAGEYFSVIAGVNFALMLTSLGVAATIIGILARAPEGAFNAWGYAIRAGNSIIAFGFTSCFLIFLLLSALEGKIPEAAQKTGTLFLTSFFIGTLQSYCVAMSEVYRFKGMMWRSIVNYGLGVNAVTIFSIAGIIWAEVKITSSEIILIQVGAAILMAIVTYTDTSRLYGVVCWRLIDARYVKEVALPVTIAIFGAYLITQSHTLVSSLIYGNDVNAKYGGAARIVVALSFIPSIFQSSSVAVAVKKYQEGDRRGCERVLKGTAAVTTASVIPLFAILLTVPDLVLDGIYRAGYSDAADSLIILATASFINIARGFPGVMLMQLGFQVVQLRATIIGVAVTCICLGVAVMIQVPSALALSVLLGTITQGIAEFYMLNRLAGICAHADFSEMKILLIKGAKAR